MVLYGKKALLDNINKEIVHVDLLPNDNSIIKLLQEKGINYSIRDKGFFAKFDKKLNHQGVIIHIETNVKYENFNDFLKQDLKKSIVLVVDSIQDPQNFGSILRTCDAFAVDAIIYKKDNQVQINDFVIKSSMGAVNNLNIFREVNLTDALNKLKDKGY
jgi:23S rRNA (guanosine2251-2'-O)-methyltransferase